MRGKTLLALWVLAGLGFVASLGLVYVACSWATWGAGGSLQGLTRSPAVWLLLANVAVSLVIVWRARKTRSRSAWPPILVCVSPVVVLIIANLID